MFWCVYAPVSMLVYMYICIQLNNLPFNQKQTYRVWNWIVPTKTMSYPYTIVHTSVLFPFENMAIKNVSRMLLILWNKQVLHAWMHNPFPRTLAYLRTYCINAFSQTVWLHVKTIVFYFYYGILIIKTRNKKLHFVRFQFAS